MRKSEALIANYFSYKDLVVIGNIYDNPELIEGK